MKTKADVPTTERWERELPPQIHRDEPVTLSIRNRIVGDVLSADNNLKQDAIPAEARAAIPQHDLTRERELKPKEKLNIVFAYSTYVGG